MFPHVDQILEIVSSKVQESHSYKCVDFVYMKPKTLQFGFHFFCFSVYLSCLAIMLNWGQISDMIDLLVWTGGLHARASVICHCSTPVDLSRTRYFVSNRGLYRFQLSNFTARSIMLLFRPPLRMPYFIVIECIKAQTAISRAGKRWQFFNLYTTKTKKPSYVLRQMGEVW